MSFATETKILGKSISFLTISKFASTSAKTELKIMKLKKYFKHNFYPSDLKSTLILLLFLLLA